MKKRNALSSLSGSIPRRLRKSAGDVEANGERNTSQSNRCKDGKSELVSCICFSMLQMIGHQNMHTLLSEKVQHGISIEEQNSRSILYQDSVIQ